MDGHFPSGAMTRSALSRLALARRQHCLAADSNAGASAGRPSPSDAAAAGWQDQDFVY